MEVMAGAIGPLPWVILMCPPREGSGGRALPESRIMALDKRDKVFKVRSGLYGAVPELCLRRPGTCCLLS